MVFFDEVIAFDAFHHVNQEVLSWLAAETILVVCGERLILRAILSVIVSLHFVHVLPHHIQGGG